MDKQLTHEEVNWEQRKFPLRLLLHDIRSPENVGSLFRIADAFGVEHVFLTGSTPVPSNRKITKTSRSTEKHVAWSNESKVQDIIQALKSEGVRIISLEITEKSIPLVELAVNPEEKICLIIGAESVGVQRELLDASDTVAHIPMYGKNSSMNLAVASGIAVAHLAELFK